MPVYLLGPENVFPPVEEAEQGLVAVGGDLSRERLLHAYSSGIFPWYSEGEPILWHSPDPRFVLTHETFRVPKSLARVIRSGRYRVTMDTAFADVVEARIYLVDMERYGEFNEIYSRRLTAPYPARACVAVAALPRGAQVEIQMVARTR